MRVLLTSLALLVTLSTTHAQTKTAKLQSIKEAYAYAQERMAKDGKGENQHKCLDLILHDEGGYAGQKLTDVVHIYYYEDHTMAEDGALQVNNKPYLILREFTYQGYSLRQEFLFEMNNTDVIREDPLIYAYSREERNNKVSEKRYYWSNELLIQCERSDSDELVEDEYMKETAEQYVKVFDNAFIDISTRFY